MGRTDQRRDAEEDETEGDPGREAEKLSAINNGWQILRDHVQTLIMDKIQLEEGKETPQRNDGKELL